MPIYEFHCASCGGDFEELVRSASAARAIVCTHCGRKTVERRISGFAAHAAPAGKPGNCPLPVANGCGQCCMDGACGMQ